MSNILEPGTIVKNKKGNDFEIQTRINIGQKEEIEKFIGDTPWNKIKVVGHADHENIKTTLDAYECIEDLIQCCEFTMPEWLSLKIGKEELSIFI